MLVYGLQKKLTYKSNFVLSTTTQIDDNREADVVLAALEVRLYNTNTLS